MENNKELKKKQDQQDLIVNQIMAIARSMKVKFSLKDEEIPVEKAFSSQGLLPAIVRRADQLSSFCMGYGLGVSFERADGAILGVSVAFDNKVAISLRLLCITDVILEIVHTSSSDQMVALDLLVED